MEEQEQPKIKVTRVVLTTKEPTEKNSEELIEFYEKKLKLKLDLQVQETPDDLIDIELHGYVEDSEEETLIDKIGIPYDKESNI